MDSANAGKELVLSGHAAAHWIEETLNGDGDFARFPGLRWRNPLAP